MKNQNQTRPAVWVQCPECQMTIHRPSMALHLKGNLCWGDSVPILNEETEAVWTYWKQKRRLGKRNTIPFLLSPTELIELLNDAGITAKDIGQALHQYALARYNDTGNYEVGNCRFITVKENIAERVQGSKKAVVTPTGKYPSMYEAAKQMGIKKSSMSNYLRSDKEKWSGWYYEGEK